MASSLTMTGGVLEMEEVEGLMEETMVGGGGGGRRRSKTPRLLDNILDCACDPHNRKRLLLVSVVVAFLILLVMSKSGGDTENKGHLTDVELKPPHPTVTENDDNGDKHDGAILVPSPMEAADEPKPAPVEEPKKEEPTPAPTEEAKKDEPKPAPTEQPKQDEPKPAPTEQPKQEEPKSAPAEEPAKKDDEPPPPDQKPKPKIPELPWNRDHLPLDDASKEALVQKWGHWHFWDGDEDMRPKDDYLAQYPNGDIPDDKFPDNAWQLDAVYVNHFLNDADQLISRAMEAIFTEYGHGKPLPPEGLAERMKMFHWDKIDLEKEDRPPAAFAKRGARDYGGWTTKRSFDGLVRRLLHAMMTKDTFTVVMGGHSAAAGNGNHFRQSYMMQFHVVMEPIFARLGVQLITRNMAQGGMGTIQAAMGSGDIYGDNIDLLIWDSGMTEGFIGEHVDLFLRQGLLGGKRVPVLWGGNFDLLRMLHNEADADVGEFGTGMLGIATTKDEKQALTIPWAARYMKCDDERQDLCSDRFNATCWIDRPDGIKPNANQRDRPRGQVKWHPGWRVHQLQGRVLAFSVLEALQVAINLWSDSTMTGQPLSDEHWHVTEYFDNIRTKAQNLDPSLGECYKINGTLPVRMCNTAMKGRTQYTPRADPEKTSVTSILKPAPDGYVPKNELKPLYEGPDVHNPAFDVPEGEVDVVAIVSNRRRRRLQSKTSLAKEQSVEREAPKMHMRRVERQLADEAIVPGKGWQVFDEPEGYCDGTYESQCGRDPDAECFLYGHPDGRGAVIGTDKAGWLVMELKGVKEGIIVVKIHSWHFPKENSRTQGWKTVNNERRRLHDATKHAFDEKVDEKRELMRSYSPPELPDTFYFDYAIDGKITSLNSTEFLEQKKQVQRVVETLTFLDDSSYTGGKEKDVEVAIRLRGCDICAFGVSHIYWA